MYVDSGLKEEKNVSVYLHPPPRWATFSGLFRISPPLTKHHCTTVEPRYKEVGYNKTLL